jgi:hypothetical protein
MPLLLRLGKENHLTRRRKMFDEIRRAAAATPAGEITVGAI